MNFDRALNIIGAIVTVALVTTIVAHPQSAKIVSSAGSAFSNSLRAAMGK